jgi:hypothetical protein
VERATERWTGPSEVARSATCTSVLDEALAAGTGCVVSVSPRVVARIGLVGELTHQQPAPALHTSDELGHRSSLPVPTRIFRA